MMYLLINQNYLCYPKFLDKCFLTKEYPSIYLYCIAAMTCSAELSIADASYTMESNQFGEEAIIICHDSYRIHNTTTNEINATCIADDAGLVAEWCWVPPCEGRYWFVVDVQIKTPLLKC